jgi:Uma2 family endonuclease
VQAPVAPDEAANRHWFKLAPPVELQDNPDSERFVTMSTITPTQPLVSPPLRPRRITVDEYERIIASGSLNEPKKIELIDGYLVMKMSKSAEHGFSVKEALKALERMLPPGWTSRKEEPVRIPKYDEPEPDITIVRGSDADYRHRIPDATDVALLVEVSAKNVTADRQQGDLYGRSGIPVYWIVNLADRRVEVYTDPGPSGYASRTDFPSGQQIPVSIDGRQVGQIAVDDILP